MAVSAILKFGFTASQKKICGTLELDCIVMFRKLAVFVCICDCRNHEFYSWV